MDLKKRDIKKNEWFQKNPDKVDNDYLHVFWIYEFHDYFNKYKELEDLNRYGNINSIIFGNEVVIFKKGLIQSL